MRRMPAASELTRLDGEPGGAGGLVESLDGEHGIAAGAPVADGTDLDFFAHSAGECTRVPLSR